uniref:CST complex subunit STN1 n=1 Tax=Kryptolebias marmoratus TaxID=37003 RepID=A0A3Q3H0J9_KRYMA
PSLLWGLDPVFSAFARLYIKDILQMTESIQVPIYFYNQHPIYKVDVLGTVVYRRERDTFFCYGDDGTAVINCLCWKSELLKDEGHTDKGFSPAAELKKLREAHQRRCRLEIGELLRVRGPVKTSRQQREIMASTYKVDDPVMVAQITWMMDVPQLYRECYDKPFELKADTEDFLKQKLVTRFRPHDVQDLLQPLISIRPPTAAAEQLLKEVLQVLQDEGVVYRKLRSQDEVYHVTRQDKDLHRAVREIIREDSRKEKDAEKGLHVLHILSAVRQRHSLNVSRAVLVLVLKTLECSSDIVSTSDSHYTVF